MINENIKHFRKTRGMSPEELAELNEELARKKQKEK